MNSSKTKIIDYNLKFKPNKYEKNLFFFLIFLLKIKKIFYHLEQISCSKIYCIIKYQQAKIAVKTTYIVEQ